MWDRYLNVHAMFGMVIKPIWDKMISLNKNCIWNLVEEIVRRMFDYQLPRGYLQGIAIRGGQHRDSGRRGGVGDGDWATDSDPEHIFGCLCLEWSPPLKHIGTLGPCIHVHSFPVFIYLLIFPNFPSSIQGFSRNSWVQCSRFIGEIPIYMVEPQCFSVKHLCWELSGLNPNFSLVRIPFDWFKATSS